MKTRVTTVGYDTALECFSHGCMEPSRGCNSDDTEFLAVYHCHPIQTIKTLLFVVIYCNLN